MMPKRELQSFIIPRVNLYAVKGNVWAGSFGDYPILDLKEAQRHVAKRDYTYLQDVCRGPYVDFTRLKNIGIRYIDDCFVACKENQITIYNCEFDNSPKKIMWHSRNENPKPMFFEPKLTLFATPKTIEKTEDGYSVESEVFDIIDEIGFDGGMDNRIGARFFKPIPKDGVVKKDQSDFSVLFKMGGTNFSWYLINSAKKTFTEYYFSKTPGYDTYQSVGCTRILNIKDFIKHLKREKETRDAYFRQQYGR